MQWKVPLLCDGGQFQEGCITRMGWLEREGSWNELVIRVHVCVMRVMIGCGWIGYTRWPCMTLNSLILLGSTQHRSWLVLSIGLLNRELYLQIRSQLMWLNSYGTWIM